MKTNIFLPSIFIITLFFSGCRQGSSPDVYNKDTLEVPGHITATVYNSNFIHSHDTYNGLSTASDGKIYYVLCSELMDVASQMYSLDPENGKIEHLGDLTEMAGEKGMKVVAQGKSHSNFFEMDGKLYFSTSTI